MYAKQYATLPALAVSRLLAAIEYVANNARAVDMDLPLRRQLALLQVRTRGVVQGGGQGGGHVMFCVMARDAQSPQSPPGQGVLPSRAGGPS